MRNDYSLQEFSEIPGELLEIKSTELYKILSGPSLFRISGDKNPPILLSTLLHGNETTGFEAMQKLLRKYRGKKPPRSILFFIGNVLAAKEGLRHLEAQEDYNRIWSEGSSNGNLFAQKVLQIAKAENIFANIDMHNNTGKSPRYSCVSRLEPDFLGLAELFSDEMVYYKKPHEAQSKFMSQVAPSITIESGQVGDPTSTECVFDFLERVLELDEIPVTKGPQSLKVYHSVAALLVPRDFSIGFGDDDSADLLLGRDFDYKNFQELPENSLLGHYQNDGRLLVVDEKNNDMTEHFLSFEKGEIRLKRHVIPSMLTQDKRVIAQDCLGYFMQKYVID